MSKWIVIKVANADDEPPIALLCPECGEEVEHECNFCPECGADMRDYCTDEQPTIEPQQWIPCSEMLPEAKYGESDTVLCCTELGLMYILYWNGGNWCVPTGETHQWVNHKTGWHDKVIAWMPLPEPYEGGEKNETD